MFLKRLPAQIALSLRAGALKFWKKRAKARVLVLGVARQAIQHNELQ
jgi:hypothetical protein